MEIKPQDLKLTFRHGGVLFRDIPFTSVVSLQRAAENGKSELWDLELTTGESIKVRIESPYAITALATLGTLQDNYEMPLSQIKGIISEKSRLFTELKPELKPKQAK